MTQQRDKWPNPAFPPSTLFHLWRHSEIKLLTRYPLLLRHCTLSWLTTISLLRRQATSRLSFHLKFGHYCFATEQVQTCPGAPPPQVLQPKPLGVHTSSAKPLLLVFKAEERSFAGAQANADLLETWAKIFLNSEECMELTQNIISDANTFLTLKHLFLPSSSPSQSAKTPPGNAWGFYSLVPI